MKLIAVPFGVAGTSWFAVTHTTKSGRLVGYRWIPKYRGDGGQWRGPTTVDALPADFNRVPSCARPSQLPDVEAIANRNAAALDRSRKAEARWTAARLARNAKYDAHAAEEERVEHLASVIRAARREADARKRA